MALLSLVIGTGVKLFIVTGKQMSINCQFVVVLGSDCRVCDDRIVVNTNTASKRRQKYGFYIPEIQGTVAISLGYVSK